MNSVELASRSPRQEVTESVRVVVLPSHFMALQAERILKGAGFCVKLIPTPRRFSSNCGLAVLIQQETAGGRSPEDVLSDAGVDWERIADWDWSLA